MKTVNAIKSAFDLFSRFWGTCIALLGILLACYIAVFFLTASAVGIVGGLAYLLSVLLKSLSAALFYFFKTTILLFLVGIFLLVNAVLNVYINIAWTIFFLDIVKAKKLPNEVPAVTEPAI